MSNTIKDMKLEKTKILKECIEIQKEINAFYDQLKLLNDIKENLLRQLESIEHRLMDKQQDAKTMENLIKYYTTLEEDLKDEK